MAKAKQKDASVKVAWVPIEQVKPNPENPRKISEAKIKELMQSMTDLPEMLEFRFLVVDRYTGYLLGGNQRWTAAKRLGLKKIPVAYSDEMTEEQKNEFIIRDNIEAGEWDEEALHFQFKDFPLVNWGLVTGAQADAADRDEDKSGVADAKVIYDNATIKQIVVYFDAETHTKITNQLDIIRDENYFGDNAEVLLFLIDKYGHEQGNEN